MTDTEKRLAEALRSLLKETSEMVLEVPFLRNAPAGDRFEDQRVVKEAVAALAEYDAQGEEEG